MSAAVAGPHGAGERTTGPGGHTHPRHVSRMTRRATAVALSPELNLVAEQRHLYIERLWGLESPSAYIRKSPRAA